MYIDIYICVDLCIHTYTGIDIYIHFLGTPLESKISIRCNCVNIYLYVLINTHIYIHPYAHDTRIVINCMYVHTYLYVCTLTWSTTGIKKHFLAGRLLHYAARRHALHLLFHGDYLHVHDER